MSQERDPYGNVKRVQNRCNQIDMQEVLKREIYKQSYNNDTSFKFGYNVSIAGGAAPVGGAGSSIGPGAGVGFEDWEIYFDSVTKNGAISDLPNGIVGFSITDINRSEDLKNIIEMTIPRFYFPRIANPTAQADPLYPLVAPSPDYFFNRRVYLEVVNFPSTQAVQAGNNMKYHWEFEVRNLNSVAIELVPLKESFFLHRPLNSLQEIQFKFFIPNGYASIPIPLDTIPIAMIFPPTNPIRFITVPNSDEALNFLIPPTSEIGLSQVAPNPPFPYLPIPAIAAPGISVFITGFESNTPQNSVLDGLINNPTGVFVTAIINDQVPPAIPRYVFEIGGIDGTLAPTPTVSNITTMVLGYRRIAFPIRFTCIRDQLTNYIAVNHL
jgi:hypothetical protein